MTNSNGYSPNGHASSTLTYVGHSTVLIEMDGVRLMTDPVLRKRVGHLYRQVGLSSAFRRPVDAVLISHLHWDHLDLPSLRQLGRHSRLIVPRGAANYMKLQGFRRVRELGWGETVDVGGVQVTATPAFHSGERHPLGPAADCQGYMIVGQHQVYFAGDTDVFPGMADLSPALDVALLPVWGWGPTLGEGHMDPLRAAQSLAHLDPRVAVPIHWGTYCPIGMGWMHPDFLSRPPREFADLSADLAPGVDVQILQPGQSYHPAAGGGQPYFSA
jgi:L-ascorbate metabolism protein UlaG (beta-lactamase superfamily)